MSFLKKLFSSKAPFGEALYDDAVRQSRQPVFFADLSVPDTLDGRFDLIILHLAMVRFAVTYTGEQPGDGAMLRAMDERFVVDMDHTLREIGVGDLSVGKKVKDMMGAYNGRWTAYSAAFAAYASSQDAEPIGAVIVRNIYRDEACGGAQQLSRYCQTQIQHLKDQAEMIRSAEKTPWAPWAHAASRGQV